MAASRRWKAGDLDRPRAVYGFREHSVAVAQDQASGESGGEPASLALLGNDISTGKSFYGVARRRWELWPLKALLASHHGSTPLAVQRPQRVQSPTSWPHVDERTTPECHGEGHIRSTAHRHARARDLRHVRAYGIAVDCGAAFEIVLLICVLIWESSPVITDAQLSGLDHVLNEARLNALYLNSERRMAQIWFECLTVDEDGEEPEDPAYGFWLYGITRITASVRDAVWNDTAAPALPFALDRLSDVVHSFGGTHVYGWEFFDKPDDSWNDWRERLSLDARLEGPGGQHTIDLFQEYGIQRHLDLRIWFGDLAVTRQNGDEVVIDDLIAASRRWWAAMYAGDPRVQGHGIVPAGNWTPPSN